MNINPPRRRSAAYRIPGLVVLALLGGVGIWAAHRSEHEFTETSVTTASPRTLLSLNAGGADLVVSRGTGTSIRIEQRVRWIGDRPTRSIIEGDDGQIVLEDDCPGGVSVAAAMFSFDDDCSITYRVQVPAGQDVRLIGGSGDIALRDLSGRITAIAGSGDVSASGLRARTVQLDAGSGDVSAGFALPPTSLRATAGSGDVSLRVPGDDYRITASTGAGDRSIDGLTSRAASKRSITARAGSGDVSIERSGR